MLVLAKLVTVHGCADILNNQETDRSGGNMIADEKTIMELYAPPFEAVAASVAGYMCRCEVSTVPMPYVVGLTLRSRFLVCSYNRVNGVYACENPLTLKTMLRGRFNFVSAKP